jgi:hypothetical protein
LVISVLHSIKPNHTVRRGPNGLKNMEDAYIGPAKFITLSSTLDLTQATRWKLPMMAPRYSFIFLYIPGIIYGQLG